MQKKIVFIGAGNMNRCIVGGMVKHQYPTQLMTVTNPFQNELDQFRDDFGVNILTDNIAGVKDADVVVLGVKPQVMDVVCKELAQLGDSLKNKLFISLAVGITSVRIAELLGTDVPMVRCMPNTPCLIGMGVIGLYANGVSDEQQTFADSMMKNTGETIWVNSEEEIDAVAAVTGSAPAYFFLFMESMVNKALDLGFSEEDALRMVKQVAAGSTQMAQTSEDSLTLLREKVTSKGGTTAAAIASFQSNQLESIVDKAMTAACERAAQLAKELG